MLYEKEWKKALENWQEQRVFLLYSKDEYELRRFSEQTQSRLEKCEQTTAERFPGPAPDLAAVTDAAGMMSFFGTRRVLVLPFVEPQALSDADAALLADLMEQAENSVFVITLFIKDDRTAKSKKCKLILDAAEKKRLLRRVRRAAGKGCKTACGAPCKGAFYGNFGGSGTFIGRAVRHGLVFAGERNREAGGRLRIHGNSPGACKCDEHCQHRSGRI